MGILRVHVDSGIKIANYEKFLVRSLNLISIFFDAHLLEVCTKCVGPVALCVGLFVSRGSPTSSVPRNSNLAPFLGRSSLKINSLACLPHAHARAGRNDPTNTKKVRAGD